SIISWQFLTSSIPPNVAPADVGGMGPAIVGTVEITALATVMAVPLGILGAIDSGAMLAVARAVGETAPLLFTILTVTTVNKNVFSGANTSLPSQIFANANSPYVGAQARGWGAALTLIVMAFVLMVVARFITARFSRFSR